MDVAGAIGLLEQLGSTKLALVGLALAVVAWRWIVHEDRKIEAARDGRHERTGAELTALSASVAAVARQVEGCATISEFRRLEADVRGLQADMRVDMAAMQGKLDVMAERLTGQAEILGRIDEHLRAGR